MEHEKAILGIMMNGVMYAERGLAECASEDFVNADCARVFRAMQQLHKLGQPIDIVTLDAMLERNHISTLLMINESYATEANFPAYIHMLKSARKLREFRAGWLECLNLADEENESVYAVAQELLDKVACIGGGEVRTVAESVDEAVTEMGERVVGEPTGFYDLDKVIGGLVRGNLIIVAGRPSMGKSTFAINTAQNVCEKGRTVALFSLEDTEKSIIRRMVCGKARISISDVRDGDQAAIEKALAAKEEIRGYKLFVVDRGAQSAQSIASECYKIRQRAGLDLVIVDYLGLIRTRERKNSTRNQEIGEVTRAMKQLAKDLNCTVMLVSQLNRGPETRGNKKPMMADLRESGDIEQDADVILFPFRPCVYDRSEPETDALLIIAKNRDGATGEISLHWRGEWFLFQNAATGDYPAQWR